MTDDQHRIGQLTKAQILIADTLERFAAQPRDPAAVATWLAEQLQDYGWRPPLDLTDVPPARPAHAADEDSPGRQQFRAGLCDRYGHQPHLGRCDRCGTELATGQQK